MILWLFTCIFDFFLFLRCVALFDHVLQCVHPHYTSHNIIPKIFLQNLSVLCVKTQFLTVFDRFFEIPVATSCLFWGPKTGPDQTCEHYTALNTGTHMSIYTMNIDGRAVHCTHDLQVYRSHNTVPVSILFANYYRLHISKPLQSHLEVVCSLCSKGVDLVDLQMPADCSFSSRS